MLSAGQSMTLDQIVAVSQALVAEAGEGKKPIIPMAGALEVLQAEVEP